MCGIFGLISKKKFELSKTIDFFSKLKHRGEDLVYIQYFSSSFNEYDIVSAKSFDKLKEEVEGIKAKILIGMNYFSVFGKPKIYENFVFNGEVFNYRELLPIFDIKKLENDGVLLKKSFENCKLHILKAIYAFAYFDLKKKKLFLVRDEVGVNPLFYRLEDNFFVFGSENKVVNGFPLNPRYIAEFNIKKFELKIKKRINLFKEKIKLKLNQQKEKSTLENLKEKVEKCLIDSILLQSKQAKKVGVLFSGGVDSTFIAKILQENEVKFKTLIVGDNESQDFIIAQKIAEEFGFEYKIFELNKEKIEEKLDFLVNNLETSNIMKISVAIPMYFGSKINDYKVILSGIGSEELFGGYERHKKNVNLECKKGLLTIWERDLYRDNIACFLGESELRVPFLDKDLIILSSKIPPPFKIKKTSKKDLQKIEEFYKNVGFPEGRKYYPTHIKKYIFRLIAEKYLGIYAFRPKKAAQYGSKSEKLIEMIAKERGLNRRELLKILLRENEKIENFVNLF